MVNSEIIHHEMNEILKIKKKEVNKMRFDKERFFKDLQEKKPEVYGNDKVQELIGTVIDRHYKKVENDEIVYDDDLLLELYDMVPEMSFNEIDEYGMCLSNEMQMMIDGSYQHEYMMLGRLQQDCEYAMNFDQEEHIAMWLEARTVDDNRMNVPSPSELVEDAKEIQGMLDELDYVLDNCTLMEKKQETDIELEEEMEDIEK